LKYFLKFLIALRGNYTSYKGNYGQQKKSRKNCKYLTDCTVNIHKILNKMPIFSA
jgi:hypothetical protein